MFKGKNLWIALGVGAVAYYLWMQNKKTGCAMSAAIKSNQTFFSKHHHIAFQGSTAMAAFFYSIEQNFERNCH